MKNGGEGMKRMQTKNLRKVRTKERAINNGFLKKYSTALSSVASTFQKEKPDYILALTRKGPCLLELMRLWGIWAGDIPVISEKAIDFIPHEQLKDKKVIIFDDIIISGTTIKDLLSNLTKKYDAKIKLVCVAIDKKTIALDNDGRGNYWIEVDLSDGKKKKIYLDYKVALSKDERFIFCNEIVRSFAFLNKSYDMDYPIFYTSVNPEIMSSLLAQSNPDKAYSLTTVYQHNNGYQRYTFLPAEKPAMANLSNNVFRGLNTHPQIYKIRAYYNKKTKEAALVPMVTFGIHKELIKKKKVFSGHFSCYNDLINQAREFIDPEKEAEAIYRLIWYIVSYIYGISFHLRNSSDKYQLLPYSLPSQALHYQDLLYLFGPSLSQLTIKFLDSHFAETIEELKKIHNMPSDWAEEDYKRLPSDESDAPMFDTQRRAIYNKIKSYIKDHVKAGDTLTDQMATIFEGLYSRIEIPTQENVRKIGIRGDEHKRLKTGFNYEQIKDILSREGMICQDFNDVDLHISLALDFLVDAGIQIPIFYYERDDGYLERAYRWGEDALSSFAKRFGYLVASATKGLFKYIKNQGDEKIPKIPFEKIGVMFFEGLKKPGNEIVDILDDSTIPPVDDRLIKITQDFSRHGRVSYIYEEELPDDPKNRYMFVEWCEKEGIVQYDSEGKNVLYSDKFFENNDFLDGCIPRLISEDKTTPFESLAKLLYQIDRDIDKSPQSDFLIALTTCGDHKSYLEAIRVMLALFFKSPDGKFSLPLKSTIGLLEGKDEEEIGKGIKYLFNKPELENDLNKSIPSEKMIDAFQSKGFSLSKEANLWKEEEDKWTIAYKEKNKDMVFIAKKKNGQLNFYYIDILGLLRTKSYPVSHEIRHKKKLRSKLNEMIKEIEEYFDKQSYNTQLLYKSHLLPHVRDIKAAYNSRLDTSQKEFKEKLEILGELCIGMSTILENLLEIGYKIYTQRKTKKRTIHRSDLQVIEKRFNNLIHNIKWWNAYLEEKATLSFDGLSISDLPKIEYDESRKIFSKYDYKGYHQLMQKVLPQISDAYECLERIYNNNYTPQKWEEDMSRLFRKEKDLEELLYRWVIWYDIKDSSGRRKTENKEKSLRVKRYINQKLKRIKEVTNDGEFNLEEDDEKHILVEKDENLRRYLSEMINATAEYQMFMRIGVISVRDTGELFYRLKTIIKSSLNHILSKRLGTYLKDGKVDGIAEGDGYHTVAISKKVIYPIWGNEKQFELGGDWHVEFISSQEGSNEHYSYFPDLEDYVAFYIAKCYLDSRTTLDAFIR